MNLKKSWVCGFTILLGLTPTFALAQYETDSDTGANRLDFLENMRRRERENRLTDEQKKLLAETQKMRENLPNPLDPNKPMPIAFEGDELVYDQLTGEFSATGKVHIVQLDNHQFDSDGEETVRGNVINQEIEIPGKARMLQLTPDMPRVTLEGFHTYYNYGTKMGTMGEAKGKVDHQYVSGKRFEFYPDHVVIYDGTSTKCNAQVPDYHTSAEKITIWPGDRMIMDNVKFWIKDKIIYTRDRSVQNLADNSQTEFPRAGYNSREGVWISQDVSFPVAPRVTAKAHLYASTKNHLKPNGDIIWENGGSRYSLLYGYYEDRDNHWIKKEPSFLYHYGNRIGKLPLSYGLDYEVGRWYNNGIRSNHSYYAIGLGHDPIIFSPHWYLYLGTNYNITHETYDSRTVHGWNVDVTLLKYFDNKWAAYAGYYYSTKSRENSLFAYNLSDYSRKIETGFSYRVDDKNRFVCGFGYDVNKRTLKDIDYYWFHDIHCSQIVLRYRAKRQSWQVHWSFLPW